MLPCAGTGATFGEAPETPSGAGGRTPGAVDGSWPGVDDIIGGGAIGGGAIGGGAIGGGAIGGGAAIVAPIIGL